ncbi:MAG: heme exporter protein CcmB [Anaerolineales bacterium]|nr:heme exporter protein CcmB [Anaerolineales bacterium]
MVEQPQGNTPFWSAVWAVVWKDLKTEQHTRQIVSVMVFFALAAVVTFNFAIQGDLGIVRTVSGGLLWITILLAGTLGLNRSFAAEQENRSIDALLMAPIDRSALYLGKVISVFIFAFVLELAMMLLFTIFFNKPFWMPQILGMLLLGTLGYIAAGVLVTSMTIQTRARVVLLPVLLLPLTLPVVLAAASVTAFFLDNPETQWEQVGFAVSLVVFYDVLMLVVGFFTYGFVVDE